MRIRSFILLFVFCAVGALALGGGAQPAFAAKTFWQAVTGLFSKGDEGPDPSQTLQAPFAAGQSTAQSAGDAKTAIEDKPGMMIPLQHAHTTEAEIGKWLVTAVSNSMSYTVGENPDVAVDNARYFAPSGQAQFRQFLQQSNIQKVITNGGHNIRSFVTEAPLLLNSGTANDRFRWLFEVPMMVSYMDANNFDYKTDTPINQNIVLTVQVGRTHETDDPDNMFDVLIETWAGKIQQIDKK